VSFDVAHQSYLPSLARRDEVVSGNSLLKPSHSGAAPFGLAAPQAFLDA
jgi:hypothetical protein